MAGGHVRGVVPEVLVACGKARPEGHEAVGVRRVASCVHELHVPAADVLRGPGARRAGAAQLGLEGTLDGVLDDVALVAQAEHEVVVAEVRVVPHDVEYERRVAERHDGLGGAGLVVPETQPVATAEQDDFHETTALLIGASRYEVAPGSARTDV